MFSVMNYTAFSCTMPADHMATANNIEGMHNSIHNSIGGYGHMGYLEVAAFDPVFWLHHANVDRLFAIWQALNPDSYIEPTRNAYGSYYERAGSTDSGSTREYCRQTGRSDVRLTRDSASAFPFRRWWHDLHL